MRQIKLRYSLIFVLVGLALTAIIVFLSKILLILGIAAICFLIGFIIDYLESQKRRKK